MKPPSEETKLTHEEALALRKPQTTFRLEDFTQRVMVSIQGRHWLMSDEEAEAVIGMFEKWTDVGKMTECDSDAVERFLGIT